MESCKLGMHGVERFGASEHGVESVRSHDHEEFPTPLAGAPNECKTNTKSVSENESVKLLHLVLDVLGTQEARENSA